MGKGGKSKGNFSGKGDGKSAGKGGKFDGGKGGGKFGGKFDGGKGKGKPERREVQDRPKRIERGPAVLSKRRTLELITSLAEDDDEREAHSKKISWILRHGASRVGLDANNYDWVSIEDLRKVEILEGITEDKLLSVINESNSQKPRYELRDSPDGKQVRAIAKEDRRAMQREGVAASKPDRYANTSIPVANPGNMRVEAPTFVPATAARPPAATPAPTQGYMVPNMQAGMSPMNAYPMMGGFFPQQAQQIQQMQMAQMAQMQMQMAQMQQQQQGAPQGQVTLSAGEFQGKIKSFNQEKGFGFIESPQTQQAYGRDVFLHKSAMGDLKVGMDVIFTVEKNKQGMPQARTVRSTAGGGKGSPGKGGGKGKDSPKGKGGGKGGGKDAKGKKEAKGKGEKKEKEKKGKDESAPAAPAAPAAPLPPGDQSAAPAAPAPEAAPAAPAPPTSA